MIETLSLKTHAEWIFQSSRYSEWFGPRSLLTLVMISDTFLRLKISSIDFKYANYNGHTIISLPSIHSGLKRNFHHEKQGLLHVSDGRPSAVACNASVTKQKLGIDKVLVDPQNIQTDCPENASKIFLVHFLSELRFLYDLVKNANKK